MALRHVLFPGIVHNPNMLAPVTSPVSLPWRHLYSALGEPFVTPVKATPLRQLH